MPLITALKTSSSARVSLPHPVTLETYKAVREKVTLLARFENGTGPQ